MNDIKREDLKKGQWVVLYRWGEYRARPIKTITDKQIRVSNLNYRDYSVSEKSYSIIELRNILAVFDDRDAADDRATRATDARKSFEHQHVRPAKRKLNELKAKAALLAGEILNDRSV